MNILIVKLSAVGDVVHTLPSLAALRKLYPDAHINVGHRRSGGRPRYRPSLPGQGARLPPEKLGQKPQESPARLRAVD